MKKFLCLFILIGPALVNAGDFSLALQGGGEWAFTPRLEALEGSPFHTGSKGEIQLEYGLPSLPALEVYVNGGYGFLPTRDYMNRSVPDLHRMEYALGLAWRCDLNRRIRLKAYADAGWYYAWWDGNTGGDLMASGGLSLAYRFLENLRVFLSPRYRFYAHGDPGSIHALDTLLGLSWQIP
jgi:hypothetical protein